MYTAGQPVSRHGRPQWHAARGPILTKEISLTLLSARINPTPLLVVLVLRRLLPHRAATTPTSFLSSRKENYSLAVLSICADTGAVVAGRSTHAVSPHARSAHRRKAPTRAPASHIIALWPTRHLIGHSCACCEKQQAAGDVCRRNGSRQHLRQWAALLQRPNGHWHDVSQRRENRE